MSWGTILVCVSIVLLLVGAVLFFLYFRQPATPAQLARDVIPCTSDNDCTEKDCNVCDVTTGRCVNNVNDKQTCQQVRSQNEILFIVGLVLILIGLFTGGFGGGALVSQGTSCMMRA